MNLQTEKNRKRNLLIVVLLAVMLSGCGLTLYFYGEWASATTSLAQSHLQSQISNSTLSQINATAPRVTIVLSFTPVPTQKIIPTNTVTYLTGVVIATNLTDLFYPCTMLVLFNVTCSTTNPNAMIQYNFIPYQSVYLMKGIQRVEIPWGLFPLACYNMNPGDTITLSATAHVIITWEPIGSRMTDQTVTALFTILIGS